MKNTSRLIRTLKGEKGLAPFWFMRQAGRYLPEYREIRSKEKDFLKLCYNPKLAAEITLQPIRRFGMDAAIIFSDILVIPDALGMKVWFEENSGPKLATLRAQKDIESLSMRHFSQTLSPVYEAISGVEKSLPGGTAIIGFSGSPWTLACYMLDPRTAKDFAQARAFARENKKSFSSIMDILVEAIIIHLSAQVNAGADVVQLFDSWAGVLSPDEFRDYVIAPTKRIVSGFKQKHPGIPVIGFPRGARKLARDYALQTGVDAVSVDGSEPLGWISVNLLQQVAVQGNLDNELLAKDKDEAVEQTGNDFGSFGVRAIHIQPRPWDFAAYAR